MEQPDVDRRHDYRDFAREGVATARRVTRPTMIWLAGGETIHVERDGDNVLLAIDLGAGRDGVLASLPAPAAAWLAGVLAVASGVKLGDREEVAIE